MNEFPVICYAQNSNGPLLGYCKDSGVHILEVDGLKFKNLSKDGSLKPYEDWRLSAAERAADLASRLSTPELVGLMLHAGKQSIPGRTVAAVNSYATYDGREYDEAGVSAWTLTDQQKKAVQQDHVRAFLMMEMESVDAAVHWNNAMQVLCEQEPFGIPCNNSSNPRQTPSDAGQFFSGKDYYWSLWPTALGLAATFDPEVVRAYGHAVAMEGRALGLPTTLAPQIDLATEPRWSRFHGTFGESPKLATAMAQSVCDGMQTTLDASKRTDGVWGWESVIAMPKHWPGGGTVEGGRDSHHAFGKYAVYPGNNLEQQLRVFTEGAFRLQSGTGSAAAVMPYYNISWKQDTKYGENVGNNFSRYIVTDLLREKYGFDGVVCTDFSVADDPADRVDARRGNCWGVETLTVEQRFLKLIEAGVDQFGDVMCGKSVLRAIELGEEKYGADAMRRRLKASATRILTNLFRLGLFENPYLVSEQSQAVVGSEDLIRQGLEAQKKSVVLLKNHGRTLPLRRGMKVYYTKRHIRGIHTPFVTVPPREDYIIPAELVSEYFQITDDPDAADFALFCIDGPQISTGYDRSDLENGGNGYVPISLQFGQYTAKCARAVSIAGGDPLEPFTNRSYRGKTVQAENRCDAELLAETKKRMGEKPVVTVWKLDRPAVPAEIEPYSDALLVHFGVDASVMLELLVGAYEPSGLLPCQMPKNMDTVEQQAEDVPFDMECYTDGEGDTYDFAYGRNWSGKIEDVRSRKYR